MCEHMWNCRSVWKQTMGFAETIIKENTFHVVSKTPELMEDHVWSTNATPSQRTGAWEQDENESTHPHHRHSKFKGMTTNIRNNFKVIHIDVLLTVTTKTCRNPLWRKSHLRNTKKQFFMNTMAWNTHARMRPRTHTHTHTHSPPTATGKCFSNPLFSPDVAPNHFCLIRQQQESKGKELYNKAELCHFRSISDGTQSSEGIHSVPLDEKWK
jgi:hypothetical protein